MATPSRAAQVSVAGSSAMCEPWPMRDTPSSFGVDQRSRAGFGRMGGQPESAAFAIAKDSRYGSSDEQQLVTRHVEPDHATTRGPGGGAHRHGHVRRLIVSQRADDQPDRVLLARRLRPVPRTLRR